MRAVVACVAWSCVTQGFRCQETRVRWQASRRQLVVRPERSETSARSAVWPVQLSVFAQMIGEGIAISSLPLHMTSLGASPIEAGLAVSSFSVAQLVCCPVLVRLSEGRRIPLLRVCLAGATAANIGIAASSTPAALAACRFVSGAFAASVPVAQAAVTETTPSAVAALSRLAATSQSAIVLGPLAAAGLLEVFALAGVPPHLRLRCVFVGTALFAAAVLAVLGTVVPAAPSTAPAPASSPTATATRDSLAQPLLRLVALVVGWSLTLSVYGYGMFAPRFLGYDQARLSLVLSAGALVTIASQLSFPTLVAALGLHAASAAGLLTLALGLAGQALLRHNPLHAASYLANRFGSGVADTATAALVAEYSSKRDRANNLALIQSTRAGARILTPLLTGHLFARSCNFARAPGALPFLADAACALLVAPIPLYLKRRPQPAPPS